MHIKPKDINHMIFALAQNPLCHTHSPLYLSCGSADLVSPFHLLFPDVNVWSSCQSFWRQKQNQHCRNERARNWWLWDSKMSERAQQRTFFVFQMLSIDHRQLWKTHTCVCVSLPWFCHWLKLIAQFETVFALLEMPAKMSHITHFCFGCLFHFPCANIKDVIQNGACFPFVTQIVFLWLSWISVPLSGSFLCCDCCQFHFSTIPMTGQHMDPFWNPVFFAKKDVSHARSADVLLVWDSKMCMSTTCVSVFCFGTQHGLTKNRKVNWNTKWKWKWKWNVSHNVDKTANGKSSFRQTRIASNVATPLLNASNGKSNFLCTFFWKHFVVQSFLHFCMLWALVICGELPNQNQISLERLVCKNSIDECGNICSWCCNVVCGMQQRTGWQALQQECKKDIVRMWDWKPWGVPNVGKWKLQWIKTVSAQNWKFCCGCWNDMFVISVCEWNVWDWREVTVCDAIGLAWDENLNKTTKLVTQKRDKQATEKRNKIDNNLKKATNGGTAICYHCCENVWLLTVKPTCSLFLTDSAGTQALSNSGLHWPLTRQPSTQPGIGKCNRVGPLHWPLEFLRAGEWNSAG